MALYASNVGPYGPTAAGLRYNLAPALAIAMRNGGQVAPILKLLAKTETKMVPINEQKKGGPQLITNDTTAEYTAGGSPTLLFRDTIPAFNASGIRNLRDEWDDLIKQDDETTATATLATAATALTVANIANLGLQASSGARKSYVQLNGGEIVEVTNIVGSVLTITRGQLGTTDPGTTYAIGTRVVVKNYWQDGADYVGGFETTSVRDFNLTQVWRRDIFLSGTTIAMQTTGGTSQLKTQRSLRTHDIMAQMAHDSLYGVRNETGAGSTRIATMGGVIRYGTTVTGLTLNKANLRSQLDTYAVNGGNVSEAVVLCGVNVWGKVCDLKDLYVQNGGQPMASQDLNFDVKTLTFWDFAIPFAQDNTLNPDDMLIINPKYADLVMVKGRELNAVGMGVTGDNRKEMLVAEGTLRVRLGSRNLRYYPNVA
jgi:hypothetical protein